MNFADHFSSRFFQNAIKSSISMENVVVPNTAVNLIVVSRLNNMEGLNSVSCLSNRDLARISKLPIFLSSSACLKLSKMAKMSRMV